MSFKIALIGECMIELQEVEPGKTQQTFGGDTLNAAIYIARLNPFFPVQADYVTALGTDNFSSKMMHFWEKEGVGSSLVIREPGEQPGLYYIQLDESGERHFSYWRGEAAAKKCFEYEDSPKLLEKLADYDAVYLSGISLAILTQKSRANLFARLPELKEQGVKICFDYNHRPHLWQSQKESETTFNTMLSLCDMVFVGLDELTAIHGVSTKEEGHRYLADKGVQESIIRSGSEPCSIWADDQHVEIPADVVSKVVDTTAAGDSFSGVYLLARNSGCSVEQATRIAHQMAAYVIQHKGAVAPLEYMPDFSKYCG